MSGAVLARPMAPGTSEATGRLTSEEYHRRRGQLLRAAAWHAFVAVKGLNAADGLRRWKENQRSMVALRRAYAAWWQSCEGRPCLG